MGKEEMPRHLRGYKRGDTVPYDVFIRACNICSNPSWSSDAAYYDLKPDPAGKLEFEKAAARERIPKLKAEIKELEELLES